MQEAAETEWDTEGYVTGNAAMAKPLMQYVHATKRFARERSIATWDGGATDEENDGNREGSDD